MFFSPIFILYYARYIDNTSCHRSKYYLYYYDMIQIGRILLCLYCQRNWMKLIEFSKVCDLQKICYSCFLMSYRYLLHRQYMLGFVSFLMIHYLLYLVVSYYAQSVSHIVVEAFLFLFFIVYLRMPYVFLIVNSVTNSSLQGGTSEPCIGLT